MNSTNMTPSPELVRKQLRLILDSDEIRNSQILAKFLKFVVLEKLAEHEEEIKEYTIGVKALGRSSDFNPQLDAIVRIHAGRLRRILLHYYLTNGKNDPVVITIPKGTYIPNFEFPDSEAEDTSSPVPDLREAVDLANNNQINHVKHPKPILVICPFSNLSPDNSKDYFVTGIAEQISFDLARFQNISVISYYLSSAYGSGVNDLKELKKEAGADYVLTGSVRFNEEMIRLNLQLLLSENGKIAWSETYVRQFTARNILDIQEEIADQAVNTIADDYGIIIKLDKGKSHPFAKTELLNVQEAIYQYFEYTQHYDTGKFDQTLKALEQAIKLEPDNALAHAVLANMYLDVYAIHIEEDVALLEKALNLAQTAVELDENCQHAQKALAKIFLFVGKKDQSLEKIELCISLNPKAAGIMSAMGLCLICLGEFAKGFNTLFKSMNMSPIIPASTKLGFALFYFNTKKFSESLTWMQRLSSLQSPFLTLLSLAVHGKVNRHNSQMLSESERPLGDHAYSIISRTIYNTDLKSEILDGLVQAGLEII